LSDRYNRSNRGRATRLGLIQSIAVVIAAAVVAGITYYYSEPPLNVVPQEFARVIYVIIIATGGYLLIRIISAIIMRVVDPRFGITRARAVKNFFQIVAAILLSTLAFSLFGFNVTNWLIGAGFIGIVLGLAAQQVLSNLFAGIALLASDPFEIGDRLTLVPPSYGIIAPSYSHEIMFNGYTGVVKDVGIFYTEMFLDEGVPLVLPNSVVISSLVMNHTRVRERTARIRMDLDKRISFERFKEELSVLLKSKDRKEIDSSTIHIEIVDIGLTTYQVAIWLWTKSTFEEPIKTIIAKAAMEIQSKLTNEVQSAANASSNEEERGKRQQ